MCGGDLDIAEGASIAECEYCGTKQTVPKATDENLQNLFNRANTLRIKSEFDKAEKLYEKIIQADSTQSEAYWGLILCKYGIEYVDDPATFKKVPTCHRASFESIVADDNYKSALENADMSQRAIYEEQAKEIDRIQKDILSLAQKEETYDVFICYKETDASGKRTQDSVIANDIYHQLTQEGFKIFYAAITLEGKLGSAYEPIIFAALNSAKVMLVIGTRPEYFNAVWVKNEWSRYLKIIKSDRSKLLIPCYRDMDAYELPEEFAHLQAQDMSKIGFINDVIRGIKKTVQRDEPKPTVVKETVVTSNSSSVSPLIKRAKMFIEDGEWESAEEYCEKVLDMDPENGNAYLYKLMAQLNVCSMENLLNLAKPYDHSLLYEKVMRFADKDITSKINEHISSLYYDIAMADMRSARTPIDYEEVVNKFKAIGEYKDSPQQVEKCLQKIEEYNKNNIYNNAFAKAQKSTVLSVSQAIKLFESISGWKDADEQIAKCKSLLPQLKEKSKRIKKTIIITGILLPTLLILINIVTQVIIPSNNYKKAIRLKVAGNYVEAYSLLSKHPNHKDAGQLIFEIQERALITAQTLADKGQYRDAYTLLTAVGYTSADHPLIEAYEAASQRNYKTATNKGLTHIVIDDGVTNIYNGAFAGCTNLTSVTIGNSVTTISDYAFDGCTNLTSVTIGDSVTTIGEWAFAGCTNLTSVTIPDSVTTIGEEAFHGCSSLTSVTIGNSVTTIGNHAFSDCESLTSVTIPDSVTTIGGAAFSWCSNLANVIIGDSVTTIGDWAFFHCFKLTSVTIGESVTTIGDYAFAECSNLKSVTIGESVTTIGYRAFYCTKLTNVTIPDSVTTIGEEAFAGCRNLMSVTIGNSVTTIGNHAFNWCTNLTTVTIPDSVTTIGDSAFSNCDNLISVIIGNSVTTIGKRAFSYCYKLTSVTFAPPYGWWYASDANATSGTVIYAPDLSNTETAAQYLRFSYANYYWHRN